MSLRLGKSRQVLPFSLFLFIFILYSVFYRSGFFFFFFLLLYPCTPLLESPYVFNLLLLPGKLQFVTPLPVGSFLILNDAGDFPLF